MPLNDSFETCLQFIDLRWENEIDAVNTAHSLKFMVSDIFSSLLLHFTNYMISFPSPAYDDWTFLFFFVFHSDIMLKNILIKHLL